MGFFDKVKKLDSIFAWSFFGVILAILFFIYQEYIKKDYTEITLQVVSKNNVLDVKENISDLRILYRENELISLNKELKILDLKIINSGTQHISQAKYDQKQSWGLVVENAQILNIPEIKSTSHDYIMNEFKMMILDSNRIYFPKAIFDCNEFIELKILVFTEAGANPIPKLFGKISGIHEFKVVEERNNNHNSVPKENNILIILFKVISYIGGVLLLMLLSGIIISDIGTRIQRYNTKRKTNRIINSFKKAKGRNLNEMYEYVFEMYRNHGITFLNMANDLLKNNDLLSELIYVDLLERLKLDKLNKSIFENVKMTESFKLKAYIDKYPRNNDLIFIMEKHNFIKIDREKSNDEDGPHVQLNITLNEAVNDFLKYLKYNE